MQICLKDKIFSAISSLTGELDLSAYVIGGYVRDCILKRDKKKHDIDIVVIGNGISFAKKVAASLRPSPRVVVYKSFGTAMFKYGGTEFEFVGARKESYRRDSRKPIVEDGSLQDDQNRRDFTINALAISLHPDTYGELLDPFDGRADLEKGLIRTPLDPDKTFSDDPLRMLRAIRFATQLHFQIEEDTFTSIRRNKDRIQIVSAERITGELEKIMQASTPSIGFHLLDESGLLEKVFPEFTKLKGVATRQGQSHKDNFDHTLQVLDSVASKTENIWLRWAALLHDIAKPQTRKYDEKTGWTFHGHDFIGSKMIPGIFKRFKLPLNEKMKFVQKLVALHLRPISLAQEEVTDSAIRRLLFDAGDDIDDLMLLCESDITSKNEVRVKQYLRNFELVRQKLVEIEEKDALRNFQPPVSGENIMETFGLSPCKTVGIIKNAIREAILEGEITNNYEEAYAYMVTVAEKLDLKPVKGSKQSDR